MSSIFAKKVFSFFGGPIEGEKRPVLLPPLRDHQALWAGYCPRCGEENYDTDEALCPLCRAREEEG